MSEEFSVNVPTTLGTELEQRNPRGGGGACPQEGWILLLHQPKHGTFLPYAPVRMLEGFGTGWLYFYRAF